MSETITASLTVADETITAELNTAARGLAGSPGATGSPGPNSVTASTTSDINGILAADGANVQLATSAQKLALPVSTAQAAADAVVLAAAIQRANHTGTQTLSTISDAGTAAAAATGDFTPIAHATDTANPHAVTATQVGLGNADNTSDSSKPVSTAQAIEIATVKMARFYATDYGVVADGTTDDTDDLQAAIDAAAATATASAPCLVVLPAGLIRVTTTAQSGIGPVADNDKHCIGLQSNVQIQGVAMGVTIVKPTDATPSGSPVFLGYDAGPNSCDNIRIMDLTVDGNKANISGGAGDENEGINFKGGIDCQVLRCEIRNTGQDGIDLDAGLRTTISDCWIHDCDGNGIHNAGGGPEYTYVSRCKFERNGVARAAADADTGAGIDGTGSAGDLYIWDCVFQDNAREVLHAGGIMKLMNSELIHDSDDYPAIDLIGVGSDASSYIDNIRLKWTGSGGGVAIKGDHLYTKISNSLIGSSHGGGVAILATSANQVTLINNRFKLASYSVHLILTSGQARVQNNDFEAYGNYALRIENSDDGIAEGNNFTTASKTHIQFRAGSSGWNVINNDFPDSGSVSTTGGGGVDTKLVGNRGYVNMTWTTGAERFARNDIGTLHFNTSGAAGAVVEQNDILTAITHTTATFNSNTWRRNTGAASDAVFKGTTTLAAGASTVASAGVSAESKINITLKTVGGTIAGQPYIATITPGTGFTLAGGGGSNTSVYNWELTD